MNKICQWVMNLIGWKITGELPNLDKYILIVAPHTSNWDLSLGILARCVKKIDIRFLAKKEIFIFPFRSILRWLGGTPVDRSKKMHMVDQIASIFEQHDKFILGLAPEGTRSPVKKWKFGFYYIAIKANVPILLVGFDYQKKEVQLHELFHPTGDLKADYNHIREYYLTVMGLHDKEIPELTESNK